ncbi:hypothetical protein INS90_08770 [Trueperella pecoris]|uniref:ABC-2 family transporter protein n=1 Tax=Trueperella pecoris TaxID=2733571 RepID=A0A7M1QZG2_9ACTO|nr:hypothetical protein [Trueperella pecoris]QOR47338.1 hypothetical protein INS90_08770 [Trueperella pecoris]
MKLALDELRQSRGKAAIFAGFIALMVGISFAVAYVGRGEAQPTFWDFATGISVVETNLVWSALSVSVDWLGQIIFILGIVIAASNRTYLGAGMTRRHILARSYSYGLLMFGLSLAIIGVLWGLAFAVGHPVAHGVDVASVALIFVKLVEGFLLGYVIVALLLRFRPAMVVAFAGLVALVVMLFGLLTYSQMQTETVSVVYHFSGRMLNSNAAQGLLDRVGATVGAMSALDSAYLTTSVAILIAGALGAWATLTLPMRRS